MLEKESIDSSESDNDGSAFLGTVYQQNEESEDFMAKVNIAQFDKEMNFLVDTGADISCISLKNVPDKYKSKIKQTDKLIYGASVDKK